MKTDKNIVAKHRLGIHD